MDHNPSWWEIIEQGGTPVRGNTKWAIQERIIDPAATLLGRIPKAEDITQEIIEYLGLISIRRFAPANNRHKRLKFILDWLEPLKEYAAEPIDLGEVLRLSKAVWLYADKESPTEPVQMPDAKELVGYNAATLHMPVLELFTKHYAPARLFDASQHTFRLYRLTIRRFGEFLGREAVIGDLNEKAVRGFLRSRLESNLSKATVDKERTQLLAFWRFCTKRHWVATEPEVPKINAPDRAPDTWSEAELSALLEACRNAEGHVGTAPAGRFWEALVLTIYDTAERISAVMACQWADLNAEGWLLVRAEYRKRKKRDKRFKLRESTLNSLQRLREASNANTEIFHWPYTSRYLWQRYGAVLESAGLPTDRRAKFHKIRRTTASAFEAAGGNATELLDHADRETTKRYYLDPSKMNYAQPADVLPGIGEKLEKATETGDSSEVLAAIQKLIDQQRRA